MSNCSILENFPKPCWFDLPAPPQPLLIGEPEVVGGWVTPTGEPGLGLRLDRAWLKALMNQAE